MNCYNHGDQISVAQCRDCNKGLCDYCAHFYQVPLCISCNKLHVDFEKKQIKKEFFWTLMLGIVPASAMFVFLMQSIPPDKTINDVIVRALITFCVFAAIIPGWHALNSFSSNFKGFFLIFSLPGLLVFYILKAIVSGFVGLIALPIRALKNAKRLRELNAIPLSYR